jgi:hypothetical protein
VGKRFAEVNVVNGVPYGGGGGVMVLAGISYGQQTHLHFIDGHLNAQRYRDEIPRDIVVPFIRQHIYDSVPVSANIQQLCTAIEEWDNIPQTTINRLINSMKEMCRAAWGKWWSHQIVTGFQKKGQVISVTDRCISVFPVM